MAIFQFNIELIPEKWATKNNFNPETLYSEEFYDVEIPWQDSSNIYNLELEISKILPESKSWSPDLKVWGSDESTDIEVWTNVQRI
jgi:hypothetical protein